MGCLICIMCFNVLLIHFINIFHKSGGFGPPHNNLDLSNFRGSPNCLINLPCLSMLVTGPIF